MRRWALLLALWGVGCSRDWSEFSADSEPVVDSGIGGTSGGGGIGGQTCFPGSKVCPNSEGQPVCSAGDDPSTGCNGSSCEPCALPHATVTCGSSGDCEIDACVTGFADCDGDPSTGCEANLEADPTQCGSCGNDCIATKGNDWICKQGACAQTNCNPPTTGDCDGNAQNGCEIDLLTDKNNCGFCSNACSANGTACDAGQCVVSGCTSPYADCDKLASNGCETNLNSDGANCGACNNTCGAANGSAGCTNGKCTIVCAPSYGNCDGVSSNGCETKLTTDPQHCGSCSNACSPAHVSAALCTSGSCDYTKCSSTWGDCDGNRANGCEAAYASDPNNCGNCGNKCTGGSVCKAGYCETSCSGGLVNCGGACVNLSTSTSNCGSCGNSCPAPANSSPTCISGSCSFGCNSGYTNCSGACVKLQNDDNNCGACGTVCGTQTQCIGGMCTPTS